MRRAPCGLHFRRGAADQSLSCWLLRGARPPAAHVEVFRQTLKDLGYTEGKNIAIDYRWAEGKIDQLPSLAAELLNLGVNVIVADGSRPTHAAIAVSRTMPIVMQSGNAIELGFVSSRATGWECYRLDKH
jgi:ABC-type uncharacterized transport system substrate-binding protein